MADLTYRGPSEQVFPHLLDPGGAGTLVLRPGESYDFGDEPPPGPAWWWQEPSGDGDPPEPLEPPEPVDPPEDPQAADESPEG